MKPLIYAGVSALALTAAAPSFAQATTPAECVGVTGNCSVVDTNGSGNSVSVDQSAGTGNVSDIFQDGDNQDATVTQGVDGNISNIAQTNVGATPLDTTAIVVQEGGADSVISQSSSGDNASGIISDVDQLGASASDEGQNGDIQQTGDLNEAGIDHTGLSPRNA